MVYIKFTPDTPVITDTGAEVVDDTRYNLMALRDSIVAGALVDWNMAASGGTAEEPTQLLYTKSPEGVRATITWGTTGGEDGNPKTIVYAYNANQNPGPGTWETIGTLTYTYDGSGNVTSTAWS